MDKYDIAIEFLTKYPELITAAWISPCHELDYPAGYEPHEKQAEIDQAHCLFQYLTPSGRNEKSHPIDADYIFGCLTQIKHRYLYPRTSGVKIVAFCEDMTTAIQLDDHIADRPGNVRVEYLKYYANYQREADRTFRREYIED